HAPGEGAADDALAPGLRGPWDRERAGRSLLGDRRRRGAGSPGDGRRTAAPRRAPGGGAGGGAMSGSRRAVRRPVAGVLCALALLSACRAEGDGVRVDLERMIDQPKYLPYGESTVFADGRAMQPPPAGTLPYDAEVPAPAMSTGREEGAVVEGIPLRVTLGMLEAGRERFEVYCAACHGVGG